MKMHSAREGFLRNSLGEGLLSYGNPLGAGGIFVKTHSARNDFRVKSSRINAFRHARRPFAVAETFARTPRWRRNPSRKLHGGGMVRAAMVPMAGIHAGEGSILTKILSARDGFLMKSTLRGKES